jgi:hypothetical protein
LEHIAGMAEQNAQLLGQYFKELKSELDGFTKVCFPKFAQQIEHIFQEVKSNATLQMSKLKEVFDNLDQRLSECSQVVIKLQSWHTDLEKRFVDFVQVELDKRLPLLSSNNLSEITEIQKQLEQQVLKNLEFQKNHEFLAQQFQILTKEKEKGFRNVEKRLKDFLSKEEYLQRFDFLENRINNLHAEVTEFSGKQKDTEVGPPRSPLQHKVFQVLYTLIICHIYMDC